MKTIIVGFSRNNKILSKLIRIVTRSSVSHVYVRIPSGIANPEYMVYQASGLAVNAEGYGHFQTHAEIRAEFTAEFADADFLLVESFLMQQLDKPYSIKQLIGMLYVIAAKTCGFRVKNPFSDSDHSYICVEYVAKALGITGAEEMTPDDLMGYLIDHPQWHRLPAP